MKQTETFLILLTCILFTFLIVYSLGVFYRYRLELKSKRYALELLAAKAVIKERKFYEERLKNIGEQIPQRDQIKTLAHFYELLNRAAVKYDQNPKVIPSPIAEALLNISYKYTIIKNQL
tara:strand:+ start:27941 stop:28300 length:360 start_codon:yes stop_codon:yes gene_type:complete